MQPVSEYGRQTFVALIEIEQDDASESGGWVTFDCLSYVLIDRMDFYRRLSYSPLTGILSESLVVFRAPFSKTIQRFPNIRDLNGDWAYVEVSTKLDNEMVPATVAMFGDSEEQPQIGISRIALVQEDRMLKMLTENAMLTGARKSSEKLISSILEIPLQGVRLDNLGVAVYDVGQGNCNALVDYCQNPLIYFDFGWAPNFHAKSRPAQKPDFFISDSFMPPPVVLSHWDMDHWSYAIKNSTFNPGSITTKHEWKDEALQRFWIARTPKTVAHKLGFLHQHFFSALEDNVVGPGLRSIQLWPDNVRRIQFSVGWLEACEPANHSPTDRNNSGIAMFLRPTKTGPSILLTGDADFPSIPSLSAKRRIPLSGLVAPHHGAKITAESIPHPRKGSPGKLAVSVGADNSYGHPVNESIEAYIKKGWKPTFSNYRIDCKRTSQPHFHGNTILKFDDTIDKRRCTSIPVSDANLCLGPGLGKVFGIEPPPPIEANIKEAEV